MKNKEHPELEKSEVIQSLPLACADETCAVEFFEKLRWGNAPVCPHCASKDVYKMLDRVGTDEKPVRNKRFLWRCRGCAEQYTVRIGTVYEESRLPLRHWAFAFWRACASKKGVSAREIQRHCEISYKSALFLLHRVRFALTPDLTDAPKMDGVIEIDETFCGGRPRPQNNEGKGFHKRARGKGYRKDSNKIPVLAMVQRNGEVRSKVVCGVNHRNLYRFIHRHVDKNSIVNTDGHAPYHNILYPFERHDVVNHSVKEYVRYNLDGSVSHVNTCESLFSLIKRGLMGIYHSVSKEHLHRYVGEFDFRWNTRKLSDGARITQAIKSAEGKRLIYG